MRELALVIPEDVTLTNLTARLRERGRKRFVDSHRCTKPHNVRLRGLA